MLLAVSGIQAQTEGRTPAFPGAEGYGKYTSGGRGGEVYYVTSLDDCSDRDLMPGTLRWALCHDNGGKPRTILFAVAGTINLTSRLKVQYPNVSILGQSAPGGGMPDSYETSVGLNPNDSADGARISAGGYTNLEIYLNGIADGKIEKKVYETSDKFITK